MNDSQKYIETLNQEYKTNHLIEQERELLIGENNIEKRDVKGYHGREILELLQNADDAYQKRINEGNIPKSELEVLIEFKNNTLTVSNTGTYFDKEGIKAIVQGNNTSKDKGKYIGNKGTGFRSVLNWTEEIRIYSGEFNIEFSKSIAERKFEEIKDNVQIKKQINKQESKGSKLYVPILAVPQNIDGIKSDFDTTIQMSIDPSKIMDGFGVVEQIKNIDLRLLLFLPNIDRIIINLTEDGVDNTIKYERKIFSEDFKRVNLYKYINNKKENSEQYYLFEKLIPKAVKEDEEKKDILLSIAVPLLYDDFESSTLYSFFPLNDTESPFNCVMHASYLLGDDRNNITKNNTNETIIKEQLKFLKEVALKFSRTEYGDLALRLLTPKNYPSTSSFRKNWKFIPPFSKFNLEDYYLDLIKDARVLETVNGDYISIKDYPKVIKSDFPEIFKGNEFKKILKNSEEKLDKENSFSMLKDIGDNNEIELNYDEDDLLNIINSISEKWDIDNHIRVFTWWNDNFKNSLPRLLKTQTGKWIGYQDECYFLVGKIKKGIPSWVRVPSLDKNYQNKLFEYASNDPKIIELREKDKDIHISRLISQNKIYPLVNFSYRDKNNIITTVNSSVDTYNKAIDFIKWLWSNYRFEGNGWTPPKGTELSPIKYNFPNVNDREVSSADKLYFGVEYGNKLAPKLFDEFYGSFPQQNTFIYNTVDEIEFIDFIKKFGVNIFPKINKINIEPNFKYNMIYNNKILNSAEIGASEYVYIEYELPFINKLEDILKKLRTKEVIYWIKNDISLHSYLSNKYYSENATIRFMGARQQYYREYRGQIKNYLLFVFNNTKWLTFGDSKYSPMEVLWGVNLRINNRFSEVLPVIDTEYLEMIAKALNCAYAEVLEIMGLFDFCNKITDLSSDDFYGLMLKLPEYDFLKSVELSKSIYRIIEQPSYSKEFDESDNKRKFIEEGKVLVKIKDKLQYYLASESYLPSSQIIDKRSIPILDKGQRTNNKNFVHTFGCKEYNKDFEIVEEYIKESRANTHFQIYFKEFLKFARAYGEKNDNIAEFGGRLKISLVDKICIRENNNIIEIKEGYSILKESATKWYITINNDNYDINLLSEQIENIYSNIANTPGFDSGKIGELFRTEKREDREFLVKKEFGTLDVIEDKFYNNQLKNNFIETIYRIDPNFDLTMMDVDFDNFSNINNGKKIIDILTKLGKDVDEFANLGFVYTIDLIPYYKKELEDFLRKERTNYINTIFNQAINDVTLQNTFIYKIDRFDNFKIKEYRNSIYFNIVKKVNNEFGFWDTKSEKNADEAYRENYEKLNGNNLFSDEITTDKKAQEMIYFNREKEFKDWIKKQELTKTKEEKDLERDPYNEIRGILPTETKFEYSKKETNKKINHNRRKAAFTEKEDEKSRRNKKIAGNKGELLIYNKLCSEYGKENIFPKSEAFVELGILKAGQASSGDYDLSYIDVDGNEYFVEVKVGNGQSFVITPGELEFAKNNPNQFKIYLVSEIDSISPKFKILPLKFWEDDEFILKPVIERIEVEF